MTSLDGFPEKRENNRNFDPMLVKKMYKRAGWRDIKSVSQLGSGEVNVMMLVTTSDGEREVVKISPNWESSVSMLNSSAFHAKKAHEQGVIVPLTKAVYPNDPDLGTFSVETFIEGKQPSEIDGKEMQEHSKKLGRKLRKIHRAKIDMPESFRWSQFIADRASGAYKSIMGQVPENFVPRDILSKSKILLEKNIKTIPDARQLVHGDIQIGNTIATPGGDIAVIDWDNAMCGDPIYDIAFFDFFHDDEKMTRALIEGYGKAELGENFDEKMKFYKCVIGLTSVDWYFQSGDYWKFEKALAKLKKLLN